MVYLSNAIRTRTLIIKDIMWNIGVNPEGFLRTPSKARIILTTDVKYHEGGTVITVSGFVKTHGDYHVTLSNHEDFQGVIRFVEQCSPELVITLYDLELNSVNIYKETGISSMPLQLFLRILLRIKRQSI